MFSTRVLIEFQCVREVSGMFSECFPNGSECFRNVFEIVSGCCRMCPECHPNVFCDKLCNDVPCTHAILSDAGDEQRRAWQSAMMAMAN